MGRGGGGLWTYEPLRIYISYCFWFFLHLVHTSMPQSQLNCAMVTMLYRLPFIFSHRCPVVILKEVSGQNEICLCAVLVTKSNFTSNKLFIYLFKLYVMKFEQKKIHLIVWVVKQVKNDIVTDGFPLPLLLAWGHFKNDPVLYSGWTNSRMPQV